MSALARTLSLLFCRPGRQAVLDEIHATRREILAQLHTLESYMSENFTELDTSVDALTAAVGDALGAIGAPTDELKQQLADALGQLATVTADDNATKQQLVDAQASVTDLLTDASQNVTRIQEQTAKLRSVVPAPSAEPTPEPAPPVDEPAQVAQ